MDDRQETMRLAGPADLEAVKALSKDAYQVYVPLLGAPPLPVTEDYTPRIAAGQVWLLEGAVRLCGLLVLERHPDHAMIFSVAVAPACQGQGYGSKLLRFAETRAADWGVPELRLYTNARMKRNIAIYKKGGFRETARRPSSTRPGTVIVYMAKPVGRCPA